jgi:carbon storage regulator
MLVLTRKAGEKIVLDGNIIMTVVEINGNRVKVAFEAPDEVVILRGELVEGNGHDHDLARKPADWQWKHGKAAVAARR